MVIVASAEAVHVADSLDLIWQAVMESTDEDPSGLDLAQAEAKIQPGYPLAVPVAASNATGFPRGQVSDQPQHRLRSVHDVLFSCTVPSTATWERLRCTSMPTTSPPAKTA